MLIYDESLMLFEYDEKLENEIINRINSFKSEHIIEVRNTKSFSWDRGRKFSFDLILVDISLDENGDLLDSEVEKFDDERNKLINSIIDKYELL